MSREEFLKKLQLCYFGEKQAFNEIVKYFDALQGQVAYLRRSCERKEEQIGDWQNDAVLAEAKIDEAIDYIKEHINEELLKLLQILERTDK